MRFCKYYPDCRKNDACPFAHSQKEVDNPLLVQKRVKLAHRMRREERERSLSEIVTCEYCGESGTRRDMACFNHKHIYVYINNERRVFCENCNTIFHTLIGHVCERTNVKFFMDDPNLSPELKDYIYKLNIYEGKMWAFDEYNMPLREEDKKEPDLPKCVYQVYDVHYGRMIIVDSDYNYVVTTRYKPRM